MSLTRTLALVASFTAALSAQSFTYPNFSGATGLVLHNSATLASGNGSLQITPMSTWNAGQAYAAIPLSVTGGFRHDVHVPRGRARVGRGGRDGFHHPQRDGRDRRRSTRRQRRGQGSDNGYAANAGVGYRQRPRRRNRSMADGRAMG
jgi:hypothetical protein